MKKMTTEEKAKAYDEAMERANKQRADYQKELDKTDKNSQLAGLLRAGISAIDMVFPQLAESEDERIRKGMIRFLESEQADGIFTYEARQSWIAYLEKQKEQQKIPLMNGDADLYFDNWIQHNDTTKRGCFEEGIRYAQRLQKEQKPAEKQDYSELTDFEQAIHRGFLCAGLENVPVTIIKETAQDCLNHMKTAEWSEEEALNRTYEEGFNDGLKYRKPVKRSDEDKKMSDWLIGLVNANTELSFKDKVNLTRWLEHLTIEKELSKNDKRIIDAIIIGYQDKDFRSSQIPTPIGVSKDEVIAWLKSLRPQPKQEWSEEDSDNLERVDNYLWMLDDYVGDDCATPQGKTDKIRGNIQEVLSPWLKSLPERFNLQPKKEWSEEDEKNCNRIIRFLEPHKTFFPTKETKEEMQNWLNNRLKSLRPQYHGDVTMTEAYKMGLEAGKAASWKPSEHQMNILKAVKEYVGRGSGYWGEALGSLIEDLEKL